MPDEFQYQPLDSSSQEIRLIYIAPNQDPSVPVEITLQHASLEDKPEYCALSYTWGAPFDGLPQEWDSPDATCLIKVNGKLFHVRLNLEAALRRLSREAEKRPIWIDAICINQTDVAERNTQVQNMRNIYAGAQITFAWLGPHSCNSERLLETISRWKESWSDGSHDQGTPRSDHELQTLTGIVVHFLSRNWFRRVWVLQEVVLSYQVVLLWGTEAFTYFSWLKSVKILLTRYFFSKPRPVFKNGQLSKKCFVKCMKDLKQPVLHISRLWNARAQFRDSRDPMNLTGLLDITGSYLASDPRDHVYALLGMVPDHGGIEVDYGLDVAAVFKATCRKLLEKDKNLYLFGLLGRPPTVGLGLPSWVADFSLKYLFYVLGSGRAKGHNPVKERYYNAGGKVQPQLRCIGESTLGIMGIRIDVVSWLGDPSAVDRFMPSTADVEMDKNDETTKPPDEIAGWVAVHNSWLGQWILDRRSQGGPKDMHDCYSWTGQPLWQVFLWTMRAGLDWNFNQSGPYMITRRADIYSSPLERFEDSIFQCLPGRTFAVTSKGYFCLVPRATRLGDVVMVGVGAEMPFILRPTGQAQYTFMGQAYVHGIMDGEAMVLGDSTGTAAPEILFEIV